MISKFIIPLVFFVLVLALLSTLIPKFANQKVPDTVSNNRDFKPEFIQMTGTKITDHNLLIEKIKNDYNLKNSSVTVLIGPYYQTTGIIGALYFDSVIANKYYITIDLSFYLVISPEERAAIVAHEMGHIVFARLPNLSQDKYHYMDDVIEEQILADNFAIKYVGVGAVMSFLEKIRAYDLEYNKRMHNLVAKQKQGQ